MAAALAVAGNAAAASKVVQYGPPPGWIAPPPAPTTKAAPEDAPLRFGYFDTQVHVGAEGQESFWSYRLKILKPEALAAGNITATWNPATDDLVVHRLNIIRGGLVIDVLASTRFRVIERENNLDYATLDGDLTATLQAPGLQVGDEVDFAATVRRRDPIFGDRSMGFIQLPVAETPGAYRARLTWPKAGALRWRATADVTGAAVEDRGAERVLTYELRDPDSVVPTDGAPARLNLRRLIQFTQFASWTELSNLLSPVFDGASTLAPASPLRAEAAKIAAETADPGARAMAALKLVQEQVRYVYVGLDGGNYRPVGADQTWARRFGDCKAKTVLLMALLRELGIAAEPVLVSSTGGDGVNERLPTPEAFDHVVVRATIGGKAYWLDGTRLGDSLLDKLPPLASRWALPLQRGPVDLQAMPVVAPELPRTGILVDIDATAGFDARAKVRAEQVLRGDDALTLKTQLSALSPADAERGLKGYWRQQEGWVEPATAAWRYDTARNTLVLTMTGDGKPDWDGDDKEGRDLNIEGAGFTPPNELRRPKEQDASAPWMTDFPTYKRWTTVIHLPASAKWTWAYKAAPVDLRLGGVSYRRDAELRDGVMRTTMSRWTYLPEISAAQAAEVGVKLPDFDNNISRVYQVVAKPAPPPPTPAAQEAAAGKDPTRLAALAYERLSTAKSDDAIRICDRALALDPKLRFAIQVKASALQAKGDLAAALRVLDAAMATDRAPDLAVTRGGLLIRAGQVQDGLAQIEAARSAHPDDPALVLAATAEAVTAGAFDRALASADLSVKLAPDDFRTHVLRASIYRELGKTLEALADVDDAVRLDPQRATNIASRGVMLTALGRHEDALADLEEAWRMDPLNSRLIELRAGALRRVGRVAEADELYDWWVGWNRNGAALNTRCWDRAIANQNLPKAEEDCAGAVKMAPDAANFWDSYALVALRAGRLDEAIKRYDHALGLDPRLAPSLYGRGLTKLRTGDKAGGQADIAAAKALDPRVDTELTAAGVTP